MLLIKLLPTHTPFLGIYGIVGDEYIEISSSAIGVILSVMETVLLAVTVKALINHKKADDVLEQVMYAMLPILIQWVGRGDFSILQTRFISTCNNISVTHKKQLRGS